MAFFTSEYLLHDPLSVLSSHKFDRFQCPSMPLLILILTVGMWRVLESLGGDRDSEGREEMPGKETGVGGGEGGLLDSCRIPICHHSRTSHINN